MIVSINRLQFNFMEIYFYLARFNLSDCVYVVSFFQTIVTIFFDGAIFFDINALLNITGIIEELKILLAMIALTYLKFKRPDLKGTIQVPVYLILRHKTYMILHEFV